MKPGKKLFVASLLVAAAAVQSACSANISATETADASTPVETASPQRPSDKSTDDADTTAEDSSREAESVIPPLGSFDRRDPDFIQYKPCLEMPDDFLEEAGLYDKEMMEGVGEMDSICTFEFTQEDGGSVFKLQGSPHSYSDYSRIPGEIGWGATNNGVPILTHRPHYLPDSECQAAIETERGTLSVTYQSLYGEKDSHDPCTKAQTKLKTVLELDGKNEN